MAMSKINHIKEEKIWQSEDSKEYYTQLTDTLRQYIKERYGFNATEMTTDEIIQHLQEVNDDEAIKELRELFETADLVKFAKYSTLINENDQNLVNAIEYINQTKVEEEVKAQPEEIEVEEQHSKEMKRVLITLTVITSIVLICVVGYLTYRMVYIMM
jgi:CHASE3 domain sensor protein